MIGYVLDNAGVIGLLFFFLFFVGVLIWLYRPGQKQKFEKHSQIPFKEENGHGG